MWGEKTKKSPPLFFLYMMKWKIKRLKDKYEIKILGYDITFYVNDIFHKGTIIKYPWGVKICIESFSINKKSTYMSLISDVYYQTIIIAILKYIKIRYGNRE